MTDNPVAASINQAIAGPVNGLFNLKFHQVAIYTDNVRREVKRWHDMGYTNWSEDVAILVGHDRGQRSSKSAHMAFNYDILPLELEYVSYHGPRNMADHRNGSEPFLSHLSTMVEDVDAEMARLKDDMGLWPYHCFVTDGHTNPHCHGKKRFKEAIYDTTWMLGFDIKLIQRVPWDYGRS